MIKSTLFAITFLGTSLFHEVHGASPSEKMSTVQRVYDNIATAMGLWERPELVFEPFTESSVAAVQFTKNRIIFEEKAYDICASFGERTEDAIALILGHELAHYKYQHNWGEDFTSSFALSDVHRSIGAANVQLEQMHYWETQADQQGGIFAYLGGYNTIGLAEPLFKKIYTQYGFPEQMAEYPDLDDRIAIANQNAVLLQEAIRIFETGNYAFLTGEYELATQCYEHIISRGFAGREVYNNHGVALAQQAITMMGPEEVRFVYPLEIDLHSRLVGHRGGPTPAEVLLRKAALRFQQASMYDPDYATAYVNLSCAHILLDNYLDADYYAAKGKSVAAQVEDFTAVENAEVVEALIDAKLGNNKEAEKRLSELAKKGNYWAAANLELLEGKKLAEINMEIPSALGINGGDGRKAEDIQEEIEGFNIFGNGFDIDFSPINMGTSNLLIGGLDQSTFIYYPLPNNEGLLFHFTADNYDGETALGLKMGASLEQVIKHYGSPVKIIATRQGKALYYEDPSIVFFIDSDHKLSGWMVYRKLLY